jgi:NitT/TauT family transport system substrate-binding protein/putative hydroxymethylpyrimidine transport system substrate-binding protein
MHRVAASLAAVLLALGQAACGEDGAEPGAPKSATLVLDFSPNAVHSGIYSALRRDYYEDEGLRVRVREPSASTDAPKLLRTGRAELAILDIHDLGLAAERGLDVVGVAAIVQRPLAAILTREDGPVRRPRDLQGRRAGVTGLPSDDAVLDSELRADGGDPKRVRRVTIGFNAISALASRKVDGATAFWNAEGIALRRSGVPVREFRVDDYGAPRYPELVLTTSRKLLDRDPDLVRDAVRATVRGYELTLDDPDASLDDLAESVPDIDRELQRASLRALLPTFEPPGRLDPAALRAWARWDVKHGILRSPPRLNRLFEPLSG